MFKKSQEITKLSPGDDKYNTFTKLLGNRDFPPGNAAQIAESMRTLGNFLHCIPIIVSEDGRIVDGQTRMAAAVMCTPQQDIFYVTIPNKDVAKIAIALNTNKRNWSLGNFANYWSKQEDDVRASENYKRYLGYYDNNKITHGVLIALCNRETSRMFATKNGGNKEFKEGELHFSRDIINHVEDTLAKFRKLANASLYMPITPTTLKKQQFQEALLTALSVPCFDFDKFVKNLCGSQHQFNDFAHKFSMYNEIIRIHDKKVKK